MDPDQSYPFQHRLVAGTVREVFKGFSVCFTLENLPGMHQVSSFLYIDATVKS
jgi:hypothetical protein